MAWLAAMEVTAKTRRTSGRVDRRSTRTYPGSQAQPQPHKSIAAGLQQSRQQQQQQCGTAVGWAGASRMARQQQQQPEDYHGNQRKNHVEQDLARPGGPA